ncbi:patatin-like phospholipase family protein [Aeromonas simiae]|uniref:patatin-like phospholipase family protein n=1 Tax=Aeromonas simiae TaxID=218936 RepID=UPI0005A643AA
MTLLMRACALLLLLGGSLSLAAAERPKIALVLSGGGAKGAAHIGVLKALERRRIPVDIVVGTSMGSYVAGLYAMGLSADEVEKITLGIDWNKGYQDRVGRDELSMRQKKQEELYQLRTDIGVKGNQVQTPDGFFQGQSMAALLRSATSNLPVQTSFDNLPIPYRAVATDMETVTPYVLDHGSLAKAMQASMSIQGILKPVEWEGRILADGGAVNNMPVDVAKAMGADVVIAVDISAKLRDKHELTSGLAMLDQLTTYMTQVGTDKQKALMGERDILITPAFGDMGISDFARMPEGIGYGEVAVRRVASQLDRLSLSAARYKAYRDEKLSRRAERSGLPAYYIDKVEIHNQSSLADETIRSAMRIKPHKIQSSENLEAGMRRLYALESFDRITYQIEERANENVLVVDASEKKWGPGYLNFQFGFSDDFESNSNYNVGASYTRTNVNEWGGEWHNEASLGTWKHLKSEFYTPLEPSQTFFGQVALGYDKETRRLFLNRQGGVQPEYDRSGYLYVDSQYGFWSGNAALGWNNKPWQRFSLGMLGSTGHISIDNLDIGDIRTRAWGPFIAIEHDTLDSRYFPYSGLLLEGSLGYMRVNQDLVDSGTERTRGSNYDFSLIKPLSWGRHSLNLMLEAGGTQTNETLPLLAKDLGGMFHLSGIQPHELSGRYSLFGGMRYIYRLAENDFGAFRLPLYVGGSLEQGGVWDRGRDIRFDTSYSAGSLYIGSDTFLGPVFFGVGTAEGGSHAVYLQLGSTFR